MQCHRSLLRGSTHHRIKVVSLNPQRSLRLFSSTSITKPLVFASQALTPLSRLPIKTTSLQTPRFFRSSSAKMVVKGLDNMNEYLAAVSAEDRLVIIDCYADWCGPCRMISPKVEDLSVQAENENVDFYKVNVDEVPDVAQELGVRAMPTFYFFKGGNKVAEVVGANPRAIETTISKHR